MAHRSPLAGLSAQTSTFLVAYVLVVLFAAILSQVGLRQNIIALLLLGLVMGVYIFAALAGRTMNLDTFIHTGRQMPHSAAGFAMASAILSASLITFLPGALYATGTDGVSILLGVLLAPAIAGVLIAAPFNRSRARTLAQLLEPDIKRWPQRLLVLFVTLLPCVLLMLVQLAILGSLADRFFGISPEAMVGLSLCVLILALIAGGMQTLSLARILAWLGLALCILAPLVWTSIKISGNPLPWFAFGGDAIKGLATINDQLAEQGLRDVAGAFDITRDNTGMDRFHYLATVIVIACGLSVMPHFVFHMPTVRRPAFARRSCIWAIAACAVLLSAMPAVAAFARFDVFTTLIGLEVARLAEEANWVFALSGSGNMPLITLCGSLVSNVGEAIAACGSGSKTLLPVDVEVRSDLLMLASAILQQLPDLLTSILALGAVFAIWSTLDGILLAISASLAEDGYAPVLRPNSPLGVRLFVHRFFLLFTGLAASIAWALLDMSADFMFELAFIYGSAGVFVPLVWRIWAREVSSAQITTGAMVGIFTASILIFVTQFGPDLSYATGDEVRLAIPFLTDRLQPMGAGLIAIPAVLATLFGVRNLERQYRRQRHKQVSREKNNASA